MVCPHGQAWGREPVRTWRERVNVSRFCADVFYGRPLFISIKLATAQGPSIKDIHTKSWKIDPLVCKMSALAKPLLPLVRAGTSKISKNPKFFSPKIADVRIWRTPLSAKCPHWTNPSPFYGRPLTLFYWAFSQMIFQLKSITSIGFVLSCIKCNDGKITFRNPH